MSHCHPEHTRGTGAILINTIVSQAWRLVGLLVLAGLVAAALPAEDQLHWRALPGATPLAPLTEPRPVLAAWQQYQDAWRGLAPVRPRRRVLPIKWPLNHVVPLHDAEVGSIGPNSAGLLFSGLAETVLLVPRPQPQASSASEVTSLRLRPALIAQESVPLTTAASITVVDPAQWAAAPAPSFVLGVRLWLGPEVGWQPIRLGRLDAPDQLTAISPELVPETLLRRLLFVEWDGQFQPRLSEADERYLDEPTVLSSVYFTEPAVIGNVTVRDGGAQVVVAGPLPDDWLARLYSFRTQWATTPDMAPGAAAEPARVALLARTMERNRWLPQVSESDYGLWLGAETWYEKAVGESGPWRVVRRFDPDEIVPSLFRDGRLRLGELDLTAGETRAGLLLPDDRGVVFVWRAELTWPPGAWGKADVGGTNYLQRPRGERLDVVCLLIGGRDGALTLVDFVAGYADEHLSRAGADRYYVAYPLELVWTPDEAGRVQERAARWRMPNGGLSPLYMRSELTLQPLAADTDTLYYSKGGELWEAPLAGESVPSAGATR